LQPYRCHLGETSAIIRALPAGNRPRRRLPGFASRPVLLQERGPPCSNCVPSHGLARPAPDLAIAAHERSCARSIRCIRGWSFGMRVAYRDLARPVLELQQCDHDQDRPKEFGLRDRVRRQAVRRPCHTGYHTAWYTILRACASWRPPQPRAAARRLERGGSLTATRR
jgi:hypothetical protein